MITPLILEKIIKKFTNNKFIFFSLNLINLIFGFFLASILSTLPSQTGEWGIINGAFIITVNELVSKVIYSQKKKNKYFRFINNIRIGVIYGLFVDAFKLGS